MPHSGTKTGNQGKTSFERGNTNTVKNGAVSSSPNSSPTRGVNGYQETITLCLTRGVGQVGRRFRRTGTRFAKKNGQNDHYLSCNAPPRELKI